MKLCYIGPTLVPWWPLMVALALAMVLSGHFFLSLVLFLVPVTAYEAMLYLPHISALVAYDGGTSAGHGPVQILFLSLVLCCVPITLYETTLYWSHISALVAYNGGTSVGHGPVRTVFLEPDLVPLCAYWMLVMALSGLFS